jgi:hypothetical protein
MGLVSWRNSKVIRDNHADDTSDIRVDKEATVEGSPTKVHVVPPDVAQDATGLPTQTSSESPILNYVLFAHWKA